MGAAVVPIFYYSMIPPSSMIVQCFRSPVSTSFYSSPVDMIELADSVT